MRELAGPELHTCCADDDLCLTMDRLHQEECERMCVVARDDPRKLLGMISINDVLQARIEIELVLRNPKTASTIKLSDEILDSLHR